MSMRDLSTDNKGLRFKLSLRSDVYFLVRTSDESTDKIEGSVIWYGWTNHEIFVLLVKRIETFFGRTVDEAHLLKTRQSELARFLEPIIEPRFTGMGKWENSPMYRVLMSLIRKRRLPVSITYARKPIQQTRPARESPAIWQAMCPKKSCASLNMGQPLLNICTYAPSVPSDCEYQEHINSETTKRSLKTLCGSR